MGESWPLTHACDSRLVRTDRGLGTFDLPVLKAAFNSAKISLLVFLCRDFKEQIEDPRMFDVTSEKRDNSSVIILKSSLTLLVILPARASHVTPSPSVILQMVSSAPIFLFYGISTIIGYFMLNHLYTYILNINDLIWLDFMAHQPPLVI